MWCWIFLLVSVPVLLVKSQANEMFKGGLTSEGILISVTSSIRLTKLLLSKLAIQIFPPNCIVLLSLLHTFVLGKKLPTYRLLVTYSLL